MRRFLHLLHRLVLLPWFVPRADRAVQDLLWAHAESLIGGSARDAQRRARQSDVWTPQVAALISLAELVSRAMPLVAPSDRFVRDLRRELRAAHTDYRPTAWQRVRQLPPRTQLAAGIGGATLTAGVVFLAARSLPDLWNSLRNRHTAAA